MMFKIERYSLGRPNPYAGKRFYEIRDAAGKVVCSAREIDIWADMEDASRKSIAVRECNELIEHWNMPGCTVAIVDAAKAA